MAAHFERVSCCPFNPSVWCIVPFYMPLSGHFEYFWGDNWISFWRHSGELSSQCWRAVRKASCGLEPNYSTFEYDVIFPRLNQCVFIRHSLPSSLSLAEFAQPITTRLQAGVSLTCKSRTALPEGRLYSGLPYLSGKQTFDFIVGDYNFSRISIVFLIASPNTQIFIFLFAEGFRG